MPDDRSRPQQRGSPDRDSGRLQGSAPPQAVRAADSAPAESRLAKQALVLDWDGTVTERDSLHMVIERFGDLEVFDALEEEVGGRMTLDEVIGLEMATITAPFDEVVDWLPRTSASARASASSSRHTTRSSSRRASTRRSSRSSEREGVEARVVANHVTPDPAAGARPSRRRRRARSAASAASAAAVAGIGPFAYAGDGVSDRCVSLAADRRFARDGLATWLDEQGVDYEPFDDLFDVAGPSLA